MNDRFKFRFWHKPTKKMLECYGFNEHYTFANTLDGIGTEYNPCSTKVCILLQCTGLKDKNGKLIYEGDIVRTWKFSTGITQLSVIVWNEARCGFRLYDIDKYLRDIHTSPQSMVNVTTIEVIGNIYENPELLEEE